MPRTKILIIFGAVAGLILVVGLAVGLTYQSKPKEIESISGSEVVQITEAQTEIAQTEEAQTKAKIEEVRPEANTEAVGEVTTEALTETQTEAPIKTQNQTIPQPEDGSWGQWTDWTPCSKYCRQARMLRFQFLW